MKFFRKIRQKLAAENLPAGQAGSVAKYLRYAVGEILHVVIGILIALQVNNWNDRQKDKKEEIVILNNLLENLYSANDQSRIEIVKENQLRKSLLIALGKNSNKTKGGANSISDSLFYYITWNSFSSVPVLNSYTDIKNTGKLSLITNRNIREKFANLELTLSGLTTGVKDRLTVQQIRIDNILINDVNFVRLLKRIDPSINIDGEIENNYSVLLNNQKIRNLLTLKLGITYSVIKKRKELGAEIDHLIHLLEVELNKLENQKHN